MSQYIWNNLLNNTDVGDMPKLKCACFPFVCQIIKRGCNVNDRDGLTDMTLLHYTCKSGAHGIGE